MIVCPVGVAIATYDSNGEALMTGSGFFLRPGQVVTNLHVIRGAVRAEIKTLDGKGKVFPVNGTLAVDEEGDGGVLRQLRCRRGVVRVWESERRNHELVLALQVQGRPARREHLQRRRRGQQLCHHQGGVQHLLEIVEHQQE